MAIVFEVLDYIMPFSAKHLQRFVGLEVKSMIIGHFSMMLFTTPKTMT